MTKTVRLNDLQLVLLSHAAAQDNGNLIPLPGSCSQDKAAIDKAVTSLLRRKLIEEILVTSRNLCWREQDQDMIGLFITDAGRSAIGVDDAPADTKQADGTNVDDDVPGMAAESSEASRIETPRPGSKIATVLALLERDDGATLDEMVAATGWLPHTTRAALTGLRKKGHDIARTKRGDMTCYHIAAES